MIISSFFVPTLPVCPLIYDLNLNELLLLLVAGKSIILPLLSIAGSSLKYCYKLPDVFE